MHIGQQMGIEPQGGHLGVKPYRRCARIQYMDPKMSATPSEMARRVALYSGVRQYARASFTNKHPSCAHTPRGYLCAHAQIQLEAKESLIL